MPLAEVFTLQKTEIDGCTAPFIAPVVAYAVHCADAHREGQSAKGRGKFPRFTVNVDGAHHTFTQRPALAKFLSSIVIGARCKVFRNAGWGQRLTLTPPSSKLSTSPLTL